MNTRSAKIPQATILRLSIYYRYLQGLIHEGAAIVSSQDLATHTNVNPAQLRKDLSYFGKFGVRGVGYDVPKLFQKLKGILGLERERKMAIAGLTHIGRAILQNEQLRVKGYNIEAVFDDDPQHIGTLVHDKLAVFPYNMAQDVIREKGIEVVVLAVDQSRAQDVADMFVQAGVKAILNFSSVSLSVPEDVQVRYADFTVLLDTLTFSLSRREQIDLPPPPAFGTPYHRVSASWGV